MFTLAKRPMLTAGLKAAWCGVVYSTQESNATPAILPSHSSSRFGKEDRGGSQG